MAPDRQSKQLPLSVQGAASRSKIAASETRLATNKNPGKARSRKGPFRASQKAFPKTLARDETSAQAGEPQLGLKAGLVQTREAGGGATLVTASFGRREESSKREEAPALRYRSLAGTNPVEQIYLGEVVTTRKERAAAKRNIRKAAKTARRKRTIAHLSKRTRTALGKEGAKAARKKRNR